jgi:hypothetical protein
MSKALVAGLAVVATMVLPPLAGAHPETLMSGGFGENATWLIPTADAGDESPGTAATTDTSAGTSKNMHLLASLPKKPAIEGGLENFNTDIAFWGTYAIAGNYDGIQIIDIADPANPRYVATPRCPGSQNDVSVYRNLIVSSTDSLRNNNTCTSSGGSGTSLDSWEGLRIWDWTDPSDPMPVATVKTDCGSHTHTTIPDLANERLIVYVSSYNPSATVLNCLPPHDKISVVEIPLGNPQAARVLSEPVLFPNGGQSSTSGCHDITAYPAIDLAAGACMGEGILLDISDPANPAVISTMTDSNFSFWHSATFSNDGDTVVFTDELGGGTAARCRATDGGNKGADAFYDISDPAAPVRKGYFKIQDLDSGRYQTAAENCVSHNGSLVPSKFGRDLMAQAWYQGGTSVIDFTNPAKPFEVAFHDLPAVGTSTSHTGGYWSSYWYNGRIFGTEIARGFDVMNLSSAFDYGKASLQYLNVQTQQRLKR